ncbi:MAG: SoxR reducing system RseC family protein [Bullifex sp.]
MKKEVTVYKDEKGSLIASCDRNACEGCKSSLFCRTKNYSFQVENPEKIKVEEGDTVVIDMPAGKTVLSSFMSLFLPLICFFLGMAAGAFLLHGSEIIQFALALSGLAIGFLISYIYFRITGRKFTPEIIEKKDK